MYVWIYSLLNDFFEPHILEGIGNSIGAFVKNSQIAKHRWHVTYGRICVHMNISQPLPESIDLIYHDSTWTEPLDYEHVPFKCHHCHEFGHIFQDFPFKVADESQAALLAKDGMYVNLRVLIIWSCMGVELCWSIDRRGLFFYLCLLDEFWHQSERVNGDVQMIWNFFLWRSTRICRQVMFLAWCVFQIDSCACDKMSQDF